MDDCADYGSQAQLYLDGELSGSDAESFLAHLNHCESCRRELEEAQAFTRRLKEARPFAVAPAALHERIAALAASRDLHQPELIQETKVMVVSPRKRAMQYVFAIAAMLFLILGGLLLVPRLRVKSKANSFISTAIESHRALSDATLQLEVQSESPSVVSAWFAQRVSFPFRMPNGGIAADDLAKYKLRGGRLVTFKGEPAAMLVFSLSQDLVTVLIAPDRRARAMGGDVTYSDGIQFHAMNRDRMHVVTWENKSLTYALTSNLSASKARACSTCHERAPSEAASSQPVRWMREAQLALEVKRPELPPREF